MGAGVSATGDGVGIGYLTNAGGGSSVVKVEDLQHQLMK